MNTDTAAVKLKPRREQIDGATCCDCGEWHTRRRCNWDQISAELEERLWLEGRPLSAFHHRCDPCFRRWDQERARLAAEEAEHQRLLAEWEASRIAEASRTKPGEHSGRWTRDAEKRWVVAFRRPAPPAGERVTAVTVTRSGYVRRDIVDVRTVGRTVRGYPTTDQAKEATR